MGFKVIRTIRTDGTLMMSGQEGRYRLVKGILAISRLFQYGKTQIPRDVRVALRLNDGDKIIWYSEENRIYIEKHSPT